MGSTIGIFIIITLILVISTIGSWIFTRYSLKHRFLSFNELDKTLINKYNLLDYSLIDKSGYWKSLIIWNVILYFIDHVLLLFPFLIFKYENNVLFISSIIFIVLGNLVCLAINLVIAYFLFKKNYAKNKEQIQLNTNEFVSKLASYKYIEINQFTKTSVYNFRDKMYQKQLNKSLSKIKFKCDEQWNNNHYVVFLRFSHFFIFNLKRSDIKFSDSNVETIFDQTLNNLMVTVNKHYISKINNKSN